MKSSYLKKKKNNVGEPKTTAETSRTISIKKWVVKKQSGGDAARRKGPRGIFKEKRSPNVLSVISLQSLTGRRLPGKARHERGVGGVSSSGRTHLTAHFITDVVGKARNRAGPDGRGRRAPSSSSLLPSQIYSLPFLFFLFFLPTFGLVDFNQPEGFASTCSSGGFALYKLELLFLNTSYGLFTRGICERKN